MQTKSSFILLVYKMLVWLLNIRSQQQHVYRDITEFSVCSFLRFLEFDSTYKANEHRIRRTKIEVNIAQSKNINEKAKKIHQIIGIHYTEYEHQMAMYTQRGA